MRFPLPFALPLLLTGTACLAHAEPKAARADQGRVVLLELFTSQGCSSCPAADELLGALPQLGLGRDRVLPLAFHVDYWDGLGWPDPFASRDFTERQHGYVSSGRLRSPDGGSELTGAYTPQMIVDGVVHMSGQRRALVLDELRRAGNIPAQAALTAQAVVNGEQLTITAHLTAREKLASAEGGSRQDWRLIVAITQRSALTRVAHGENSGATLKEAAIVRVLSDHVPIAVGARDPVRVTLVKPKGLAWANVDIVAFVQAEGTHVIADARAIVPTWPAVTKP